MRTRIYSIMMLFALTISSCILEEGDWVPKKTQAGQLIWELTSAEIANNIYAADLALKLDLWITAPESEKNQWEDRYFPENKLRFSAGSWNLTGLPRWIISRIFIKGMPFTRKTCLTTLRKMRSGT